MGVTIIEGVFGKNSWGMDPNKSYWSLKWVIGVVLRARCWSKLTGLKMSMPADSHTGQIRYCLKLEIFYSALCLQNCVGPLSMIISHVYSSSSSAGFVIWSIVLCWGSVYYTLTQVVARFYSWTGAGIVSLIELQKLTLLGNELREFENKKINPSN